MKTRSVIPAVILGWMLAATILPTLIGIGGCKSASQTAYVAETAGYVTLKTVSDAYKAWIASGGKPTVEQAAKAHSLFASAQQAELIAIDATVATGSTNSATASAYQAQTISDLVAYLKTLGVKL